VINKDAVIDSATGNYNEAKLEYSEQEATDTVYVATYDFLLKKTDGSKYLPGSGFKLYDSATKGNMITVNKDTTGYYVDPSADVEIMVDSADGVNVRGLAPGTYYLEETTTPDGYNTLTERKEVVITAGQTSAHEVIVVNNAGAELPSTGGRGTTILYAIGAALVIGAAVLLIARRRTEQ
jgi:LPXTG-motif cell wall-anchored protein